jgi:hypothetical protein
LITDAIWDFINEEMTNVTPERRPTMLEVVTRLEQFHAELNTTPPYGDDEGKHAVGSQIESEIQEASPSLPTHLDITEEQLRTLTMVSQVG